jgi:hypothetical protein
VDEGPFEGRSQSQSKSEVRDIGPFITAIEWVQANVVTVGCAPAQTGISRLPIASDATKRQLAMAKHMTMPMRNQSHPDPSGLVAMCRSIRLFQSARRLFVLNNL